MKNYFTNYTSLIIVGILSLVLLEGCKSDNSTSTQTPTLTGSWTMTSIQSNPNILSQYNGAVSASQIGNGQLILNSNGTFSATGSVTSQSFAQALGISNGTSVITGGTFSSTQTSISFVVSSYSGRGNQTAYSTGSYTLSQNSLEIILPFANTAITVDFSRAN